MSKKRRRVKVMDSDDGIVYADMEPGWNGPVGKFLVITDSEGKQTSPRPADLVLEAAAALDNLNRGRKAQQGPKRKLLDDARKMRANDSDLTSSTKVAQALIDSDAPEHDGYHPELDDAERDEAVIKEAEQRYVESLARRIRNAEGQGSKKS